MLKAFFYAISAIVLLLSFGCSKDDSDNSNSNLAYLPDTLIMSDTMNYSMTIDGVDYGNVYQFPSRYFTPSNDHQGIQDSVKSNFCTVMLETPSLIHDFEIYRNGFRCSAFSSGDTEFFAFFEKGEYPFTRSDTDGFAIRWRDQNGTMWGTDLGSGVQGNCRFDIKKVHHYSGWNYPGVLVLGYFTCRLYDGNGNSKGVSYGKFLGPFSNE